MIPLDAASNADAKRIAALYGIEVKTIAPVGGGFSGACIFKAEDSSGAEFALRRTPVADAMPADRYFELLALLRDVSSNGCEFIPYPLCHQHSSLGIVEPPHSQQITNVDNTDTRIRNHESVWQMEPWMPGEPAQGPPTLRQLESTLETLHIFHNTAARCVLTRKSTQFLRVTKGCSPGISRRLSIAAELQDGLLARFIKAAASEPDPEFRNCSKRLCAALEFWLPWLTKQLTELGDMSFQLQPVIRDLWKPHVLFTEERVTGIIDLNALATDHVGLDVTRLFRSWFGADVDRVREAINLFCVRRSLDASERRLLTAYDASTVLLSPVTWLRRRFTNVSSGGVAQDVMQRLTELTSLAERFEPL